MPMCIARIERLRIGIVSKVAVTCVQSIIVKVSCRVQGHRGWRSEPQLQMSRLGRLPIRQVYRPEPAHDHEATYNDAARRLLRMPVLRFVY